MDFSKVEPTALSTAYSMVEPTVSSTVLPMVGSMVMPTELRTDLQMAFSTVTTMV
jgi:hypothetical protein